VSLCYLVIPAGVAIAITREGLFRIDRIVTKGMALGGAVVVIFLVYVGFVVLVAGFLNLNDRSSIPVFWGFVIACSLAVLFRPVQRSLERGFDRVLLRRQRRFDGIVSQFDQSLRTVTDRRALESLVCKAVSKGLDVESVSVSEDRVDSIRVAPGQVRADSYSGHLTVSDELRPPLAVRYPIGIAGHYFGCLDLGSKEADRYSDDDFVFLERVALRTADHSARLELQAEAVQRELDFARTRLRIASDLHDDIGSNLSGLALLTDSVDGDPRQQQLALGKIGRFARSMVESLRDIVWSIDPDSDRAAHLAERIRDTAGTLLAGMDHSVTIEGSGRYGLDPEVRRNVLLVFKEAVHNAVRHSGATRVDISLRVADDALELQITDNGRGFDASSDSSGLGRRSMVRRADEIGGALDVKTAPGQGTTVLLTIKMAQTRHSQITTGR
ncbi:MAG: ATP-binding protein, partial [Rhodothermales bacterium]|nr:ATP-binding protein [Rhodothermales bacterium]